MKKYMAYMRCGFLEGCAYRSNFITGMLANFIQAAVLYYVWRSIFRYQGVVNGYTWEIMRKYVFVAFLCNCSFSFGFEMNTAKRIIKGDIILDLLKPVPYRGMLFFRMLGTAGMEFGVTLILVGCLYLSVNGGNPFGEGAAVFGVPVFGNGDKVWDTVFVFPAVFLYG